MYSVEFIEGQRVVVETLNGEFGFCEICSNPTPRVRVTEDGYSEEGCQYCWDAYGEIHQAKKSDPFSIIILERIDKWKVDTRKLTS